MDIALLTENLDKTIFASILIAIFLALIPKSDYFFEKITKLFMLISVFALIVLTLIVSYDVIMRKLFSAGSIALQELEWHLYDIVFLFAIAYTLSKDKHVRVDIFYDKFPFKVRKTIHLITIIFFVIPLTTLITVEAIPFVQMSYAQNEASGDPGGLCCRWVIKSSIILGFFVLYTQSIAEIRKTIYQLKHHKGN